VIVTAPPYTRAQAQAAIDRNNRTAIALALPSLLAPCIVYCPGLFIGAPAAPTAAPLIPTEVGLVTINTAPTAGTIATVGVADALWTSSTMSSFQLGMTMRYTTWSQRAFDYFRLGVCAIGTAFGLPCG
jgi:hypothetical protein